ncbi:endonuclease Q family protein [Priestia abyssalis]|uniref:endonuclease Q family protein n=1 Tax=Priestia abyssalis TaxID=1221450 RepID=UPI000995A8F3|nr:endonuclease Q family protein [Priestia abyssalis]
MQHYYVDLHIHIGRTGTGKPVKITASRSLTIPSIIEESSRRKGMDMIGIIDGHVPEVLCEFERYIETGGMVELEEGGFRYHNLTIILGSEIEIYDKHCHGPIHVLVYFGSIKEMTEFSLWLGARMKNITLSSQRIYEQAGVVQEKVKELNGLFIPAHVFTPFKSLYGKGVRHSLTEVFNPSLIDGIELGLSANTDMAGGIEELKAYSFLSNSDAHSVAKIGREYQQMKMESLSFTELKKVLKKEHGRKITANYGLNPLLGKYYHTVCEKCFHKQPASSQWICAQCGHHKFIKGVSERIKELPSADCPISRPPYIHQVPLDFIPGIGAKTLDKLIQFVGTEMYILHEASEEELKEYVKPSIAGLILKARKGELDIHSGGGGIYGKVMAD